MRITVLGLGQMGHALATRLVDGGHDLTVWNRSPGRADDLVAAGATAAEDPAGAVAGAEVVMSFLTDDGAVTSVLIPDGSPLAIADGAVVVDCSTVAPGTTDRLAAAYAGHFAACPVLGGPAALEGGQATLAVAGPADVVDGLEPVLSSVSDNVRRCGDQPRQALLVKILSNYLLMGGIALVAEAVTAGQRAGMADETLVELLGSSPLVAPALRNRIEDLVRGDHDGWFPPKMGAKDVRLFLDLASGDPTPLPLADLVEQRYLDAVGLGDHLDITAVIELLRKA